MLLEKNVLSVNGLFSKIPKVNDFLCNPLIFGFIKIDLLKKKNRFVDESMLTI